MHLKRSRSTELQHKADDMADVQQELERKASQLRERLMKRAWKGMVDGIKVGEFDGCELQRIANEMVELFPTKADAIKHKIKAGVLRAHRAGELRDMREEFDELA